MDTQPTLIESSDGTRISTEIAGSGPALVVVAAALSDRSAARRLADFDGEEPSLRPLGLPATLAADAGRGGRDS
jgi:hypothetical protein